MTKAADTTTTADAGRRAELEKRLSAARQKRDEFIAETEESETLRDLERRTLQGFDYRVSAPDRKFIRSSHQLRRRVA